MDRGINFGPMPMQFGPVPMDFRNVQAAQETYINGVKVKGYNQVTVLGDNPQNVTLSGLSRLLIGFALYAPTGFAGDEAFSLTINNQLVVDSVNAGMLAIDPANGNYRAFYPFERAVSGSDTISYIINTAQAGTIISAAFYYQ